MCHVEVQELHGIFIAPDQDKIIQRQGLWAPQRQASQRPPGPFKLLYGGYLSNRET